MPIQRLVAEHVGPFERLDLDLSDGRGSAHLGPHILAGVNGSGKSTILRTIAWVLNDTVLPTGFPADEFNHLASDVTTGLLLGGIEAGRYVRARARDRRGLGPTLSVPLAKRYADPDFVNDIYADTINGAGGQPTLERFTRPGPDFCQLIPPGTGTLQEFCAAYASTSSLRYIRNPDLAKADADPLEGRLAFHATVRNEEIQAWLLSLFSKRAIAEQKGKDAGAYTSLLVRFEAALQAVCGQEVGFDVALDPAFEPRIRVFGQSLNFSQLPEGIRSTIGWFADVMMRQEAWGKKTPQADTKGIALLDEIDAHLHPLWQRRLLPAMRTALPGLQIIASSHSPFVISSCPGARVHVLDIDNRGKARVRESVHAPIGESVSTILKDIFGVSSRFDLQTERELDEWNSLMLVRSTLNAKEKARLNGLTTKLSDSSEELRSIVGAAREQAPSPALQQLRKSIVRNGAKPKKKPRAVAH